MSEYETYYETKSVESVERKVEHEWFIDLFHTDVSGERRWTLTGTKQSMLNLHNKVISGYAIYGNDKFGSRYAFAKGFIQHSRMYSQAEVDAERERRRAVFSPSI